jgi:hypothetical protein
MLCSFIKNKKPVEFYHTMILSTGLADVSAER